VKLAKILGTENAETRTLKFTSITKTSVSPSAENAGKQSQKETLNGKSLWH